MYIVVAPDSFKGSVTSIEVGTKIKEAFLQVFPSAQIDVIPMADGGEGTLDALLFGTDGHKVELNATGPLLDLVPTNYGVLGHDQIVVIEIAAVAGLPMVPKSERNPMNTSTKGIGEVILHALDQGHRQFIIGLGGSATNDGGLGMLQALGVTFLDHEGQVVPPIGASVGKVKKVDYSTMDVRLRDCRIQVATDVTNPLCGKQGASYVFAPQKGATPEQVVQMDEALQSYSELIHAHLQQKCSEHPGAGAAGGLGFAFLTLGAELLPGAQIVAEAVELEEKLKQCDWVLTGEGQSDYQTAFGKVPFYIGKLAKQHGKHTILLSGSLGKGAEQLHEVFVSIHSIAPGPVSLDESMANGATYIFDAAHNIARLINATITGNQ
ncbi:glycerate kinase [Brevibacillus sp. SYSU BS000544]|uniref:glycerate kinase n=1 Tax=Brevibacillus sp. SYSU BS000544 TaxID=3416443 RepID=UPI003CE54073